MTIIEHSHFQCLLKRLLIIVKKKLNIGSDKLQIGILLSNNPEGNLKQRRPKRSQHLNKKRRRAVVVAAERRKKKRRTSGHLNSRNQ